MKYTIPFPVHCYLSINKYMIICLFYSISCKSRDPRGRDRMVVGFTTTSVIIAFHHQSCEFEPRSWRDVLDTTLCDKIRQLLAPGGWFPYPIHIIVLLRQFQFPSTVPFQCNLFTYQIHCL
jgi:hypothetical protein